MGRRRPHLASIAGRRWSGSTSAGLAVWLIVSAASGGCRIVEHEAGFWFEPGAFALSPAFTDEIGGPLSATEMTAIERVARRELQSAFADLSLRISERRTAFWRISVASLVPSRRRTAIPAAGETWALGRFGGFSHIGFRVLAHAAVTYAPEDASRSEILEGIGRGVGHTAAHELAHAILGPSPAMDTGDETSYEFHSFARASHFYGSLRWDAARPALASRLVPGR